MTNDEADDRYCSVDIAENDSSRLAGVKVSAVTVIISASLHRANGTEHSLVPCVRPHM